MVGYSWSNTDEKYTYNFANGASFTSETDYTALFAMNTNVVYKTNNDKTVYGMYADDSEILVTATLDDLELDGVTYKLDNTLTNTKVYAENQYSTGVLNLASSTLMNGKFGNAAYVPYGAKLIDNDNDGKVDCIVFHRGEDYLR